MAHPLDGEVLVLAANLLFDPAARVANGGRVSIVFRRPTEMRLRFDTPIGPKYVDYRVSMANTEPPAPPAEEGPAR